MSTPSDQDNTDDRLRLIGLGERSLQKSYYPELKKRLAELERFRALLDRSGDLIFLVETETGRIADVNETALKLLGHSRDQIAEFTVSDFSDFDGQHCLLDEDQPGRPMESVFYAASGRVIPVELTVSTKLAEGQRYCIIVARDITERKNMEAALRLTQYVIDTSATSVFLVRRNGSLAYVNEAGRAHLGVPLDKLNALKVWDFDPSIEQARWEQHGWSFIKQQGSVNVETVHLRADGTRVPVEVISHHVAFEGSEYLCTFVTDISERKEAEQRLRESLAEKEMLLKEVHHRVKNNLQIVSSLLHLQMRSAGGEESKAALQESAARVATMALVHEQIYRSQSLSRISLDDYLLQLVTRQVETFRGPRRILVDVDAPHFSVPLDVAIPLGLIVNEVVTNSLKHAFTGRDTGTITLRLATRESSALLTVADDGSGLPPDFSFEQAPNLGMQLIWSLSRQLSGKASLETRHGTIFSLDFPADVAPADP